MKRTMTLFLCLWMLLGFLPQNAAAVQTGQPTGLEGKTLSILGDSISTYAGVSNCVDDSWSLANNKVFYTYGYEGIFRQDTWWQQTADRLGMRVLVNNSWSGSCMFMEGAGTLGAYEQRCVQLHNNAGQQPDLIAVFMGTNDQDYFADSLGTFRDIDFDSLIRPEGEGFAYARPTTCLEAYAIALHKMAQRYPNAEIYCFHLLQRPGGNPQNLIDFNADLTRLARYFGVQMVETRRCGITAANGDLYMSDCVHPGALGMDAITNAFVSQILKNSRYLLPETPICRISYDLRQVDAAQGFLERVVKGDGFQADLIPVDKTREMTVSVTMDGKDITESCLQNGTIHIESVTGEVHITASAE